MDELSLASDHGETLLGRIKSWNYYSSSSSNGASNGSPSGRQSNSNTVQLINVISVERFILQIEDTSRLFQEFWAKEKAKLEQCLKLRRFEQEFKELQVIYLSTLIGENVETLVSRMACELFAH